jgi:hypothetical protein
VFADSCTGTPNTVVDGFDSIDCHTELVADCTIEGLTSLFDTTDVAVAAAGVMVGEVVSEGRNCCPIISHPRGSVSS